MDAVETSDADTGNCPPGVTPVQPTGAPCPPLPPADTPPALPPAKVCPTTCDCPSPPAPPSSTTCFQTAIDKQQALANQADTAKALLDELNKLNVAALAAGQAYTADLYGSFKTRWDALNITILRTLDTATCSIKCWRCLIECEVCPLLDTIAALDVEINGDDTLMKDAHSLLDIQYWHQRNVAKHQAQFDRFDKVLKAWASPATTIAALLDANEKLVASLRALDPVEALLQLVLKIVPTHVAIAPPARRAEAIAAFSDYLDICSCNKGKPETCCGPDTGLLSVLMQFAGAPVASIIDPTRYLEIICCLVNERYLPAQDQLSAAQAGLAAIGAQIAAKQADLGVRLTSVLETALGHIAKPVDCATYSPIAGGTDGNDGCGPETG